LDADTVRAFLLERIGNRSTECSRKVSVALRSVLRFLFVRGRPRETCPRRSRWSAPTETRRSRPF
jgi:hypothetical protein